MTTEITLSGYIKDDKYEEYVKQPKRSGTIQCATHHLNVVIGANGLMFCPIPECANSEESY